jgi:hypothetical protein
MSDHLPIEAASPNGEPGDGEPEASPRGRPTTTAPAAAGAAAAAPLRRRHLWRWVGLALLGAAAVAALAPGVMVSAGTRRARACFDAVQAPRGAALPDCGAEMRWFIWPSYVPWTSWDARYQAEELWVRLAATEYVDAAVGRADRAALAAAADGALEAATRLRRGSKRLALDHLGPAMGVPDPGRLADDHGDRVTLLARAHDHGEWQLRLHTLDAALTEGDLAKATELAKRYATLDPRDEDLRTQVAAVLCLGDDPRRGTDLLDSVQHDRASKRHAAMSRDWGEVRALLVACAHRAGFPPPERPASGEAGRPDAPEARAAQRVRVAGLGDGAGAHLGWEREKRREPGEYQYALDAAVTLLRSRPRSSAGRRALLAALLAAGYPLGAAEVLDLCRPSKPAGEGPLADRPLLLPEEMLDEPVTLAPKLSALVYQMGAHRLEGMVIEASGDDAEALRTAAQALTLDAVRVGTGTGDGQGASVVAVEHLVPGSAVQRLASGSALFVAGRLGDALDQLGFPDNNPPANDAEARARVGQLLLRAEMLASQGNRAEAGAAAIDADEAARRLGDVELEARAAWTRLAFAEPGTRLREPWNGPQRPRFRWIGYARPDAAWRTQPRSALSETLAAWDEALGSDDASQRAARYALLAQRGDAPPWTSVHLAAAQTLAPPGGDVEVWLDAFYAFDVRRMSRRAYAFARAEAARFRGDMAAAEMWRKRLAALSEVVRDATRAELAAYLRL